MEKEGDTKNDFLYTGEQYNANTGLYYLRARYMNPSTGTFISMDSYQGSIYDPVSLHKYLYANANPVMYSDPSGYEASRLDEQVACLGIATILASAILFSQSAALNMFVSLRVNMVDSVIGLGDIYVTPRDWKDVFITFPSHNYDRRYITSIPTYLMNRHLFKFIYEVKEVDGDTDTPGVPEDEQTSGENDTVTSNKGNNYDNKPSDNHSVTDGNPVKKPRTKFLSRYKRQKW